jgi:transcriptional regulator with XRE-family HTH domain
MTHPAANQNFGEWLKAQLRARKMSQRQLADRSGVNHSTISRLVRGRVPSLETATKLMRVLDGSVPSGIAAALPRQATARVEHALRADEHLREQDVRSIMCCYLSTRRRGSISSGSR